LDGGRESAIDRHAEAPFQRRLCSRLNVYLRVTLNRDDQSLDRQVASGLERHATDGFDSHITILVHRDFGASGKNCHSATALIGLIERHFSLTGSSLDGAGVDAQGNLGRHLDQNLARRRVGLDVAHGRFYRFFVGLGQRYARDDLVGIVERWAIDVTVEATDDDGLVDAALVEVQQHQVALVWYGRRADMGCGNGYALELQDAILQAHIGAAIVVIVL